MPLSKASLDAIGVTVGISVSFVGAGEFLGHRTGVDMAEELTGAQSYLRFDVRGH
jgi:hypothetical protein